MKCIIAGLCAGAALGAFFTGETIAAAILAVAAVLAYGLLGIIEQLERERS